MSRYRKPKRNKTMTAAMALVALFMGMSVGRVGQNIETQPKDAKYQTEEQTQQEDTLQLTDDLEIPVYAGQPYTVIKDNVPDFTAEEKNCTDAFEYYGDLDTLGRCTVTFANVCPQTQPASCATCRHDATLSRTRKSTRQRQQLKRTTKNRH